MNEQIPNLNKDAVLDSGNEISELNPRVAEIFEKYGIDQEKINPKIRSRLILMDRTRTLEDRADQVGLAEKIFDKFALSAEKRKTAVGGIIFSDIGKTGPSDATPEQQELIVSIYGVDTTVPNINTRTVSSFVREYLPEEERDRMISLFSTIEDKMTIGVDDDESKLVEFEPITDVRVIEKLNGKKYKLVSGRLNPNMPLRNFYDRHSEWTLHIVSGDGVPPEAVAAAATHHVPRPLGMKPINPDEILDEHDNYTIAFGANNKFDVPEKIVFVLDFFNARMGRGNRTSQGAIDDTLAFLSKTKYKDDRDFKDIIKTLGDLEGLDISAI